MNFMINEEMIRRELEPYGILSIKSMSHGEDHVYVVHMLPLPFLIQNIVTITVGMQRFKISSGIIFDSKDVYGKVIYEAEEIMRRAAEKVGVTLRKTAEIYWVEIESNCVKTFKAALERIIKVVMELNQLFSENEHVREECLHKKYSSLFL